MSVKSPVQSRILACVNIRQLVTLAGPPRPRIGPELRELAIVEDAVLVARDGRIEAAGSAADIAIPPDAEIVDAAAASCCLDSSMRTLIHLRRHARR